MNALLLDTNGVSILFNRRHPLWEQAVHLVVDHQLAISFMSRAELLLWPVLNDWGASRRASLHQHLELHTTLYADDAMCTEWVGIVAQCRSVGRPIQTADAWIAACARRWDLPLVTADVRDFEAVAGLQLLPLK